MSRLLLSLALYLAGLQAAREKCVYTSSYNKLFLFVITIFCRFFSLHSFSLPLAIAYRDKNTIFLLLHYGKTWQENRRKLKRDKTTERQQQPAIDIALRFVLFYVHISLISWLLSRVINTHTCTERDIVAAILASRVHYHEDNVIN